MPAFTASVRIGRFLSIFIVCAILSVSPSFVHLLFAHAADHRLFLEAPRYWSDQGTAVTKPPDYAERSRSVFFNGTLADPHAASVGDRIELNLFDDVVLDARVERIERNAMGSLLIQARIPGKRFASAVIVTTAGRTAVYIDIPETGRFYELQRDPETNTSHLTEIEKKNLEYRLPVAKPIPENDHASDAVTMLHSPYASAMEQNTESGLPPAMESGSGEDGHAIIDVMVVYTPAARQWSETRGSGIDNTIAAAMANAQLTADNSDTDVTFQLVHSAEVAYEESGSSDTDLQRLTEPDDGYMDEVHDWRDAHGADLVALFTDARDVGGIGWLLTKERGSPRYAFSLTTVRQAANSYTMIHEMGHNMGLHHHKKQRTQPGPGLFDYSAGWRWAGDDGRNYCSVMSYEDGSQYADGITHRMVPYFSNPEVSHQAALTGHPADGDNARTVREIKHVIAGYRNPVAVADQWMVAPSTDYSAIGDADVPGSFAAPESKTYEVMNDGDTEIVWDASATVGWISVSPLQGVLLPGDAAIVTVSIDEPSDVLGPGTHYGEVVFSDEGGSREYRRGVSVSIELPLALALDNEVLIWRTGGDADWFGQMEISHDGEDAAQSGPVDNGGQSWIETDAPADGILEFWWKSSSRSERHHLEFYIDGVLIESLSGDAFWQAVELPVEAGDVLRWRYVMDIHSYTDPEAAGWLDRVMFREAPEPAPERLVFSGQPADTPMEAVLGPVTARIVDESGELADDMARVSIFLEDASGSGGRLSGSLSRWTENGEAIFDDLRIDFPGNGYVLIAQAPDLEDAVSEPFTILPPDPAIAVPVDGYDSNDTETWPILEPGRTETVAAIDPNRAGDWMVRDREGHVVLQQTGASSFEIDADVLFNASGAGVYTIRLTDRDYPGLDAAEMHVRIPMRFEAGRFRDDDTPDGGIYLDDQGSDTFTVLGGPEAEFYIFDAFDSDGLPVTLENCGELERRYGGAVNTFYFTPGIPKTSYFWIRVTLDEDSVDPDVEHLVAAGLDELWSDVFTVVPVDPYIPQGDDSQGDGSGEGGSRGDTNGSGCFIGAVVP